MSAFTFDVNNRIASTAANPIATVIGGLPFDLSGNLCITDTNTAPASMVNGWPLEADGRVAIHHAGLTAVTQNGIPLTASGRVATDNTNPVTAFSNGIPYVNSRISIA